VESPLVVTTAEGLYCPTGGFHIDPWAPVERAVLTHAHGDHARPGSASYLATEPSRGILRRRLGADPTTVRYGEVIRMGEAAVSLHPAGHVLGSAQVRIEVGGRVWVVSGDYKRDPDPTCAPFEPVRCDVFVTEATFALPVFVWTGDPVAEIYAWCQDCAAAGRTAVLGCYVFGKSQHVLADLRRFTDRTVHVHGAIEPLVAAYREAGVEMLPTARLREGQDLAGELVLCPPAAQGTRWARRFRDPEMALASGWMRTRTNRRDASYDRGFTLSDHADWPALVRTIRETGASTVLTTHGYAEPLARWLREHGWNASTLETRFQGEADL
jgi:putative mRNA 3-end processing factor